VGRLFAAVSRAADRTSRPNHAAPLDLNEELSQAPDLVGEFGSELVRLDV